MTNGDMFKTMFPNLKVEDNGGSIYVHYPDDGWILFNREWWNAEYKEPTKIDYRRAFKIACELLNGTILYGVDADKIFEVMMDEDGIVTNDSYEEYILTHLKELDHGQYKESEEV